MKKNDLLKPGFIKLLIPMVVILGAIILFKSGFHFGQWLYVLFH